MNAEHDPPPALADPYVRRCSIARGRWVTAIRGRIPEARDVAVAHTLAGYANKDGSRAHPGQGRLARDLCSSERTIRRSLAWLSAAGWLTVTQRGRRKLGEADVFGLTVPAPVAVDLGLWLPEYGRQWMERPSVERAPDFPPATRDRNKHDFPPVTGGRYNEFLPDTGKFLPDTESVSTGHSCVRPPALVHQLLFHHADFRNRPPAGAVGDDRTPLADLDPNDPDLAEQIEQYVEAEIGGPLTPGTDSLILGMLERQAHPHSVMNAALANEHQAN